MATFLSIEIDNTFIKIIEVHRNGEILSVLRCTTDNIHEIDGKIKDINIVADKIKDTLNINNIKTKSAIFLINSSKIIVRVIKLPLLKKDKEILSMLEIELQQIIAADLNNYKIIYEISNSVSENNIAYADYTVYCVPVVLVNQYGELAKKLNIKLIKIEILPISINTLYKNNIKINNFDLKISEVTAFIGIGTDKVSFLVARNGICDFYIVEPRPKYSCSNNSEEKDSLIFHIVKLIRYYYSVGNKKINKIFIYGENAPKIKNEITNKLHIEAEVIKDISHIKTKDISIVDKYLNNILSSLDLKGKSFHFNKSGNYFIPAVVIAIILAVFTVSLKFINTQISIKNEITAMSAFIDDDYNNKEYVEIKNVIDKIDYLKKYLKQADELKIMIGENDYVSSDILREIHLSKPSETKITSIYSDKDSTQLQCVSNSMSEASLFIANLRKVEMVDSIYMPSIQSTKGESFSYSIILKIKDVKENEN